MAPAGGRGVTGRQRGRISDLLGSPMGEPGALPPGEEREEMGEREVPEMVFSLHRLGEKWGRREEESTIGGGEDRGTGER